MWTTLRATLAVLALFAAAVWVAQAYEAQLRELLAMHAALAVAVFAASSVVAVLMPVLTNLPLVPLAVLAWGPGPTAALLLGGWIVGSALSFLLGRHARDAVLRHLPSVARHAAIERLILPQRRLLSLVLLRATFPVDVLSYALGLFSPRTTLAEVTLSTAIGAGPFALLFAWLPQMPPRMQLAVFGLTAIAFCAWAAWVLRRTAV